MSWLESRNINLKCSALKAPSVVKTWILLDTVISISNLSELIIAIACSRLTDFDLLHC